MSLPLIPKVDYEQFCGPASLKGAGPSLPLVIKSVPTIRPAAGQAQTVKKPLHLPSLRGAMGSLNGQKKDHRQLPDGDEVKWNSACACTRCKLMKHDYEHRDGQYGHWGRYPCIPDSVINRDNQHSSSNE